MACNHELEIAAKFGEPYYDNARGKYVHDWIPAHKATAFDDIDLHRRKCSICGEIRYYSYAARNFFEKGITSDIKGLDIITPDVAATAATYRQGIIDMKKTHRIGTTTTEMGEASTPSTTLPPATIIPPLGQRTTAEVFRAVIAAGYYSGGKTPTNPDLYSDYMCHALNYATIYKVITATESVQAKAEIKEFLRYLSSNSNAPYRTLWFAYLSAPDTEITQGESELLCRITYQDWDNRPKGRRAMMRALATWRQEITGTGEAKGEPSCKA